MGPPTPGPLFGEPLGLSQESIGHRKASRGRCGLDAHGFARDWQGGRTVGFGGMQSTANDAERRGLVAGFGV